MERKKFTVSFFHDTVLLCDSNGNHYSIHFPYHFWQRYLSCFKKVIVSTRCNNYETCGVKNKKGYEQSNGEDVRHLSIVSYKKLYDLFFDYKKIIEEIRNALINSDCAIIRMPSIIGILACRESLKLKKTFGVEVVANAFEGYWNYGNIAGKLLAPIIHFINKYYIKKAPIVAYITSEYMQKIYPSNGIAFADVANISLEVPSHDVLANRIVKLVNYTNDSIVLIGMIGALNVKFKGHATAIRAVKALIDKGVNCKLQIVGEGDSSNLADLCYKLGISKNVQFLGTIPSGKCVFDWMDKLDFYVQPSITEAHGRAVIEAMSRGLAVVASDIGGLKESLCKTERFQVGDYEEMSNIIYDIIQNQDRRIELAYRNYEYSKKFHEENIEEQRKLFLNELVMNVEKNG
ncbi:glycosyltransferase [Anaeromicrobium sediminis]|uniref:Glycosyl transferase family 1 domain-containing protein n=1 Tax=Anaeromicrobium sediminis TaxID=1478221 RepID=A0A267MKR8_9FIRM|nr:glycosyltransferase [Anaeromicrobium sediminis]PAB59393.1 hypothetical protein CCE28_11075 [Anaeromicrobium sediminis]